MTDFLGQELKIGQRVIRATVYDRSPELVKAVILEINNEKGKVGVLTDGNKRIGWTYPDRIISEESINRPF